MDIDEYKTAKKYFKEKRKSLKEDGVKRQVLNILNRILLSAILFLAVLIIVKVNDKSKEWIYKNVYTSNIKFAGINEFYNKYLGGVLPFSNLFKEPAPVFSEKLVYKEASVFKDGVKLVVENQYLVPAVESGIVVFMGEKEDYGKTIIVQQVNGVDVWYCNINVNSVKMYDYIEKGSMLGEAISNDIYLVFQKDGVYQDYKNYIN